MHIQPKNVLLHERTIKAMGICRDLIIYASSINQKTNHGEIISNYKIYKKPHHDIFIIGLAMLCGQSRDYRQEAKPVPWDNSHAGSNTHQYEHYS